MKKVILVCVLVALCFMSFISCNDVPPIETKPMGEKELEYITWRADSPGIYYFHDETRQVGIWIYHQYPGTSAMFVLPDQYYTQGD